MLNSGARLAARLASTSLKSRVLASKTFALPKPSAVASPRFLSTTLPRFAPVDPTETTEGPTASEASVKADQSPVDPIETVTSPLSSSGTTAAEAAATASSSEGHHIAPDHEEFPAIDAEAEAAKAAEELNSRTIFVGGLSWNVDNEWLKDEVVKVLELTEAAGEEQVVSVRIARNPMGKSRGFAFIELASPELASQLAAVNPEIDGRPTEFRLSTSSPRAQASSPRAPRENSTTPRNPPSNTVWVGNVSWGVDEADLQDVFAQYGEVKRVSLPRDQESGRSRGIAYVEYGSIESAEEAVAQGAEQGIEMDGRVVRLDYAQTQSRNSFGGERRGGAGGRGGFGGRGGGRGGFGGRGGGRGGGFGGQRREGGGGGRREGGYGGGGGGRSRQEEW